MQILQDNNLLYFLYFFIRIDISIFVLNVFKVAQRKTIAN